MLTVSRSWLRWNATCWILSTILSCCLVYGVISTMKRVQAIEERAGSCEVGPIVTAKE